MNNVIVIKRKVETIDGVEKETVYSPEIMPLASLISKYPLLRLWEHHELITRLTKRKMVVIRHSSSEYGKNYEDDIVILDTSQFDIFPDSSDIPF